METSTSSPTRRPYEAFPSPEHPHRAAIDLQQAVIASNVFYARQLVEDADSEIDLYHFPYGKISTLDGITIDARTILFSHIQDIDQALLLCREHDLYSSIACIYIAVDQNNIALVKALIVGNLDPLKLQCHTRISPLVFARTPEMARELLELGFEANEENRYTGIIPAFSARTPEVLRCFIAKYGPNILTQRCRSTPNILFVTACPAIAHMCVTEFQIPVTDRGEHAGISNPSSQIRDMLTEIHSPSAEVFQPAHEHVVDIRRWTDPDHASLAEDKVGIIECAIL